MSEAQVVTLWGGEGGRTPYMTRVILGRLRIHVFHRGDADDDCHDHPADFWTFPLVSYVEEYVRTDGGFAFRVVRAFRLHRRSAEFAHRVIGRWTGEWFSADAGQIATLAWRGKKRREWGFHTARGWVPWRIYTSTPEEAPSSEAQPLSQDGQGPVRALQQRISSNPPPPHPIGNGNE